MHMRTWQGCGLGSKGTDREDITRCQISPANFWLQFSLAWQLGRGLLGVACRHNIHDLCMQLLTGLVGAAAGGVQCTT